MLVVLVHDLSVALPVASLILLTAPREEEGAPLVDVEASESRKGVEERQVYSCIYGTSLVFTV